MKKISFVLIIGLLPALLMAQPVALNNKMVLPAASSINEPSTNPASSAKALRKVARENKQFDNMSRAFNRDFKNASDVKWTSDNNEFTGTFTKDGVRSMVWYSKNGSLLYTVFKYGADKLPVTERRIIEDQYGDYKISVVDEIHQDDTIVYVVHLENDRNIKLVTVCNGDTNIYQAYKKM